MDANTNPAAETLTAIARADLKLFREEFGHDEPIDSDWFSTAWQMDDGAAKDAGWDEYWAEVVAQNKMDAIAHSAGIDR